METGVTAAKGVFAALMAFLSATVGALAPMLVILVVFLILDFTTGIGAAWNEGEVSSEKGGKGIVKKIGYILLVGAVIGIDGLIYLAGGTLGFSMPTKSFFAMLVIIWLILNEGISILENLGRIGVPYPPFMIKAIKILKGKVESTGENAITEEKESEDK